MGRVAWEKFYSVHIKEIDDQHHQLIDFTNEIYDKLEEQTVSLERFDDFFDKMLAFAIWHFSTEEKYFAEFDYPEAAGHIAEHEKIKAKIVELKKQFVGSRNVDVIFDTLRLFDDWLFVHIMEFDQKYVEFFHQHGLK